MVGPSLTARAGRPQPESVSCRHCGFALDPAKASSEAHRFCCYGCAFAYQVLAASPDGKQISWILVQLGIAAFLAMNVMGFSLAMHASSVYPDFYEVMGRSGRVYDELLRYLLLALSAPVLVLIGTPLLESVITELRAGRWGIDGFIALSVVAAFGYSLVSTLRGTGPIYYDIATMVLVFVTLGRYLEARFRLKAARSLEALLEERRSTALKAEGERYIEVSADQLRPGDEILVRAGQRIAVDGQVVEGTAVVDAALMTGEAIPVNKSVGEAVWSGATVAEGYLRVRATHASSESWTARLKQTVEIARRSRSPVERLAQRIVVGVTIAAALCAVTAFVLGNAAQGPMAGLLRALSVLVIVCPCALGAAIPLALWGSYERVASRGVLFKDIAHLESLSRIKGVFFDKTGTLTECSPRLSGIDNRSDYTDEVLLLLAGSLTRISEHPFSRAVTAELERRGIAPLRIQGARTAAGQGLAATVESYGEVLIGRPDFLRASGVRGDVAGAPQGRAIGAFDLAVAGQAAGRFDFEEPIRPEASEAVRRLKAMRLHVGVLTGDASDTAREVARTLGVEAVTGLTPEGKLEYVRRWEADHGPCLVLGEGLNDAPVLAGSSVSLAIGGALARTREAADFVLPDNDLSQVPWLVEEARGTLRRIRINLFWAFFYNGLAVPLAVMGLVNPIVASMAMIVSSACIILHSLRNERVRHGS